MVVLGRTDFGFCNFFILVNKWAKEYKARKAERKAKEAEAEAREQSLKIAEKIYCKLHDDFNIESIDTPKDEEAVLVVAKSFRSEVTIEEAKELFYAGRERYHQRIQFITKMKIDAAHKSELEKFKVQKEEADRVGKIKYTYMAEYHEALDTVNHALRSAQEAGARKMLNTRADKQDWAIWGGFASALGGNGVGLAVASSIQRQNETAEQNAVKTRIQACAALEYYRENPIQSQYSKSEKQLREYVESRLFCDTNVDEWFGSLEFSNLICSITEGRNFVIQGMIKCPDSFTLLDRLCVLDGAVKILIKDKTKRIVAEGYFAAPGAGNMKLSEVGFYNGIVFQSLCQTSVPYEGICENGTYTYEFEPYHLWLIEV